MAELDGIEKEDITVDDDAKTVTVGLDDGDPDVAAMIRHFEDFPKYALVEAE